MFTIGQKVTCVDAENQPRLSKGKEYTVYDVTDSGVRVESTEGRIPYDYSRNRFESVSVSAEDDGEWANAIVVVNGFSVYTAQVRRDGYDNIIGVRSSLSMTVDN